MGPRRSDFSCQRSALVRLACRKRPRISTPCDVSFRYTFSKLGRFVATRGNRFPQRWADPPDRGPLRGAAVGSNLATPSRTRSLAIRPGGCRIETRNPFSELALSVRGEQFVLDERGRRRGVIVPVSQYQRMVRDRHDLAVVAERRKEPTVNLAEMKRRLSNPGRSNKLRTS